PGAVAARLRRELDRALAVGGKAGAVERIELRAGREQRGIVGVAADEAVEEQQVRGRARLDQRGILLLEDRGRQRIGGHRADQTGAARGGRTGGSAEGEPTAARRGPGQGPPSPYASPVPPLPRSRAPRPSA